ncbi:MAG: hypothetical protein ACR2MD_00260 [Aridibacter sp.]
MAGKYRSGLTTGLMMDALRQALSRKLINRNAIIHTDRGSQYACCDTISKAALYVRGYRQSMSRKGKGSR